MVGQRYTEAPDAAIILSSETLFAALSGYLFLGEWLTTLEIIGAALIFGGILAVQLIPLRQTAKEAIGRKQSVPLKSEAAESSSA